MASSLDLICAIVAGALWYVEPALGPWPLLLLAAGLAARAFTAESRSTLLRRTGFELPLLLFLASAGMGVALAYRQDAAWDKFWIIVGGVAIYGSFVRAPERVQIGRWAASPLRLILVLLPAILAAYFLSTNNWAAWAGKLPTLDLVTRWIANWQPNLPGHRLHPNVAGGLIAALIPLQIGAAGRRRIAIPLTVLAGVALILTASRGAWLALAIAGTGWAVWQISERTGRTQGRRALWLGVAGAIGLTSALAITGAVGGGALLQPLTGRLTLLRDSLNLALDTPFTGVGLAGFQMAYSSYILLLHVGYAIHSHNLLLNLWLEQGLPGLIAFGWLLVVALQTSRRPSRWQAAALASLTVILIHGMVDDAFYGSRGCLLLFIPFALLARGEPGAKSEIAPSPSTQRITSWARVLLPACACALILAWALLPGTRAAMQANLGALAQTRAELSVYTWPQWPIQDALRRSAEIDLTLAVHRYLAALRLNPANVTANRRLGQIELSLGQYDEARRHLEAAYDAAAWQSPARRLVGESWAVAGQIGRAAEVWRTAGLSQGQLVGRAWWYESIGEPEKAKQIREAGKRAGW